VTGGRRLINKFINNVGTVGVVGHAGPQATGERGFSIVFVRATIGSPGAVRLPANRRFINMTKKNADPKTEQFRMEFSNVSTMYLAQVLGVTTDAVTKLHSAGIIKQNGKARGKYDLVDATNAYLEHLRDSKGSDVAIRLTLARAKKLELENDRVESELVKTTDVVEVFRAASLHWKSIADGIPKRIASRFAKIKNPDKVRTILREELDGMYYEFDKGLNHHE